MSTDHNTFLSRHQQQALVALEIWRPVVGYEGLYEVSDRGRVRSLDRDIDSVSGYSQRIRGRVLKQRTTETGHRAIGLHRDGQRITTKVHRLVIAAFTGPAPEGMECCHNNGDPADNRPENLRWDTTAANHRDCVNHGTHPNASKTHCKRGHELTPDNLYIKRRGNRQCRTCTIEDSRRRRADRRAA